MKKQLEQRIEELKLEFESGQQVMAGLENKQFNLNRMLLRISGAIQVLEEELKKVNDTEKIHDCHKDAKPKELFEYKKKVLEGSI